MLAHLVSGRYVKTSTEEPYTSPMPSKASRLLAWLAAALFGRKRAV